MRMKLFLLLIALSWPDRTSTAEISCKNVRQKVASKGNCENFAGEEIRECYNLCELTPITLKDCKKRVNSHCCIHDGKCVMKAGTKRMIPDAYRMTMEPPTTPEPPPTTPETTTETTTSAMSCTDIKLKLTKAVCQPKGMFKGEIPDCYDICTKKIIKSSKACMLKKNAHCCMYKGRCILKGAGTKAGKIPKEHQLAQETTTATPTTMEATTKPESCTKARFRIKKAECEPVKKGDMQDCYDLCTKKPIDPKDCTLKKNSHCCLHNCRCIIRGAGTDEGMIPLNMQLELPKKKISYKPKLLPGCKPKPEPKSKPESKKNKSKGKGKGKLGKKPKRPKTTKKTKVKTTTKKSKKPRTTPTKATKKTKCPKKSTTAKPFSFSFFSKLSNILKGFGLENDVTPRDGEC